MILLHFLFSNLYQKIIGLPWYGGKGKNSKHYPGIEPSIFGVAVGDAYHYTIQAA
jgi:hypothetical protein